MNTYTIKQINKKASSLISLSNRLKRRSNHHISSGFSASPAFTIVELLVVIVVIGILAAITIVSYTGITNRAVATTLQSDLSNASTQLKVYQTLYGSYPTTLDSNKCPTAPNVDNNYCLKASKGNSFTYSASSTTFSLTATNTNNTAYVITDSTAPTLVAALSCPTGFIPVPGSGTYGTSDFCTMKYAASQVGATNVPTSVPSVQPWVNISQTTAIANAPNVAGCTGCHLITEAEYMTIAQNVLSVPGNWSGGSVGSGYIYSGHNDNAPANALVPDPSDANGYAGETNTGGNQKRTLTLTNGQVIWDLAGNVWEWTQGVTNGTTAQQPGVVGNSYSSWIEWPTVTTPGSLSVNPFPSGTGLSGSSTWNSSNGIGQLISSTTDTGLRGFLRGGTWDNGGIGGVLALNLNNSPGSTGSSVGFRVSR